MHSTETKKNKKKKNVHDHHRIKNPLGNFSNLKEQLSRPVVDTKTPKNRVNDFYHRSLSSVAPIFSAKKKSSSLEQGGLCLRFPSSIAFRMSDLTWQLRELLPLALGPEPPITGVSGPSWPELTRTSQKRVHENAPKIPPKPQKSLKKVPNWDILIGDAREQFKSRYV